ncbi:MAG: YggT family protein [Acidimicrobiales bacterium]
MSALILLLLQMVTLLLIARAILSWFRPDFGTGLHRLQETVDRVSDPIVLPVRRVMPNTGPLDLSIIAILIGINFVLVPIVRAF